MKINTDGVVLAALAGEGFLPQNILDIGTGTGVIALMLAQRFPTSVVEAVEIDEKAAATAQRNFSQSPFFKRLTVFPLSFQTYSSRFPSGKFDLIVSNPPFFIDSLKNPNKEKQVARHAEPEFFAELISFTAKHLSKDGLFVLVLPLETTVVVTELAEREGLRTVSRVALQSYDSSNPHRYLISFSFNYFKQIDSSFVIYSSEKKYSEQFVKYLQDFFTIFK